MKSSLVLVSFALSIYHLAAAEASQDSATDFLALARKHGLKAEEYSVVTEDGYVLSLFRARGAGPSVLLAHGVLDSGATWLLRRGGLAAALAARGRDVWITNNRGNVYARRHRSLAPEAPRFWDFSFHEMAVHDLSAAVDFVLARTGRRRLSLVGHSLGNMQFYVLAAMRPEYNDKVDVAIALGPAAFLNIDNFSYPLSILINMVPFINEWLTGADQQELYGNTSVLMNLKNRVCGQRDVGYEVCSPLIWAVVGDDREELEREFYYEALEHFPCSSSRKLANHLLQVAQQKRFAQYDYGLKKNMELYKSPQPPSYDLSKVTMRVALLVGANDRVTNVKNAALLRDKLPNVVSYHVLERKKSNHVDFIWGRTMDKYLFPHIFRLLDKYGTTNSTTEF